MPTILAALLEPVWPTVYFDGIVVQVRAANGRVSQHTIYVALGVNLAGQKELLGLWLGQKEGAKLWLGCLTDLKNRGLRDIFVACIDGLSGFAEAIHAAYSLAKVQLCIVHLGRNHSDSVIPLDRFRFASFAGAQIYVSAGQHSSAHAKPTLADRPTPDEVGFNFETIGIGPGITLGRLTAQLIIHTDATDFQRTFASEIGGCGCETFAETYAPVAAIPEPSTYPLAAIGLAGVAGFVCLRLRAQNHSWNGLL